MVFVLAQTCREVFRDTREKLVLIDNSTRTALNKDTHNVEHNGEHMVNTNNQDIADDYNTSGATISAKATLKK